MDFTDRLKFAIGERSLRSFAKEAEISDGALRQYLSGKSEPTRPVLIKLADAGGVSPLWLLTGNGLPYVNLSDLGDHGCRPSISTQYVQQVFSENRKRTKGWNSNSVFLVGIEESHLDRLVKIAVEAAGIDNRPALVIDVTNKTYLEMAYEFTGKNFSNRYEAFDEMKKMIETLDQVFVFKHFSKSKMTDKHGLVRSFMKILDDAHFNEIRPSGDLVFVDFLSFLEKGWRRIGAYINTNIFL